MAVIGDPTARLNALAAGGTAGLASFDEAQQSTLKNRQAALNSTLGGRGFASADIPSAAASELQGVINSATQGYTDDAQSARNLAGAQVGIDSKALDSFLAEQQRKLDAKSKQAQQNMELDRMQHEGSMIRMQGTLAAAQRAAEEAAKAAAAGAENPFLKLSKEDQDAMVRGAALQGQDRAREVELDAARQRAQSYAGKRGKAAGAVSDFYGKLPFGIGDKWAEDTAQEARELKMLSDPAAQAASDQAWGDFLSKLPRQENNSAANAFQRADAFRAMQEQPQVALEQIYPWLGTRGMEMQQALANTMNNIELQLPQFEQMAATGIYGMDPTLAAGRYPTDALSLTERQNDITDARLDNLTREQDFEYEQWRRDNRQEAMELEAATGMTPGDIKSARTAGKMTPDQALEFMTDPEFPTWAALAAEWYSRDLPAGEAASSFSSALEDSNLGPNRKAFLRAYFAPFFGTKPGSTTYLSPGESWE